MAYYKDFAYVYDRLMVSDVDYDAYAQYINDIFSRYGKQANLLCDLACGTGNMTLALKNQGFDMTGIDISEDMLNVARQKANDPSILFLNQNIASLDLYGTMDAFTCCIDGINYIISPKSLFDMLKKIKTCFINPDGLVIFDISSRYKLQNIIGNNTFIHNNKDVFYTWQNRYIDSNGFAVCVAIAVRCHKGELRRKISRSRLLGTLFRRCILIILLLFSGLNDCGGSGIRSFLIASSCSAGAESNRKNSDQNDEHFSHSKPRMS